MEARTEALAQSRRSRRAGEAPTATLDVPENGRAGPDLAPSLSRGEALCRKLPRREEPVRPRPTKDANAAAFLRRAAEPLRPPYGATALLMAEGGPAPRAHAAKAAPAHPRSARQAPRRRGRRAPDGGPPLH